MDDKPTVSHIETVDIVSWDELTESERSDFDYRETEDERESFCGFRYRGDCYDMSEFGDTPPIGWDALATDTFFSGVVYRQKDGELEVGLYM
jgi:hypothetical protein